MTARNLCWANAAICGNLSGSRNFASFHFTHGFEKFIAEFLTLHAFGFLTHVQ